MTSWDQKRIMLWAVPRSLSTAMCRVMMNSGLRTQIIFEPYSASYYFSPDRELNTHYQHVEPVPEYSYIHARQKLLQPYPDKELVVAKDHALYLRPHRLTSEWVPDSYTHTFITRHPGNTVPSVFKVMTELGKKMDPTECGYEEQVTVARLVQARGDRVIVLDAADLMDDPEGVLRAYCQAVGLTYQDSMIHWRPMSGEEFTSTFLEVWEEDWFHGVRTTSKLAQRSKRPPQARLPDDVTSDPETRDLLQDMIDDNTKFYEELCAFRLTPAHKSDAARNVTN